MVVVPEPAVKGAGSFLACGVDRAVGPAVEQGSDEAFGFPICLWPVGPGAEVADRELAAGDGVHERAVGGAVVGQDRFDLDAVATVEGNGAAEEADRGRGFLVGEDFGVGEAAVIVDGDVDELVADGVASSSGLVDVARVVMLSPAADAPAGATLDPAQLLDVDVDELAGPGALVAKGLLEPEPAEPAHAAA